MAIMVFTDIEVELRNIIMGLKDEIATLEEDIEGLQEENNFLTGGMHKVKLAVEDLLCCQNSLNNRCVPCENNLRKAVENG